MGLPVNTVAAGGLPIVESTSGLGTPVSEAAPGRGVAVTKVISPKPGLPVIFETIGAAPPVIYATFNGTPTAVTMSNGGLTATHNSAGLAGVNVTPFVSTGKFYFEVTLQTGTSNADAVGLISSTGTLSNLTSSVGTGVAAILGTSTAVTTNSTSLGSNLGTATVGDVFCVAVDLSVPLIWIKRNIGGNWNGNVAANPATGANGGTFAAGPYAPVVRFINISNSNAMTANFGSSAFVGAVPSGFTPGWPA